MKILPRFMFVPFVPSLVNSPSFHHVFIIHLRDPLCVFTMIDEKITKIDMLGEHDSSDRLAEEIEIIKGRALKWYIHAIKNKDGNRL